MKSEAKKIEVKISKYKQYYIINCDKEGVDNDCWLTESELKQLKQLLNKTDL